MIISTASASDNIAAHEHELLDYATEKVSAIPGVRLIGTAKEKAGVLSFVIEGVHPHDIGTILDQEGIAIRTGHHCAQPVMQRFGIPATARASLRALQHTRRNRRAGARHPKGAGGFRLMADLRDLYQEVILEHSKAPRNFRELADGRTTKPKASIRSAATASPSICDMDGRFHPRHQLSGLRLRHLQGVGVDDDAEPEGQDQERSRRVVQSLSRRGHGPDGRKWRRAELGKLAVFAGVSEFPTRVKCATLAWHTLQAALTGEQAVSTE